MHVVALGGAGGMGRMAARTAAGLPFVERLTVADLHAQAASDLVATLPCEAEAVAVDVTEHDALVSILEGADAVLNTVGPSFRFGVPVARAAIAAGCPMIDVCDDWEPTLDLLDLHALAQDTDTTLIIGLGASPGVSNLLARLAIEQLDEAHTAITAWDLTGAVPERGGPRPSAATVHGMHQLSGTVRVWRSGEAVDERPLRPLALDVPGIGPVDLWTIGHPEAVTLPRTWPGLHTCLNAFHAPRLHVAAVQALAWGIDRGLSERRAASWAEALEGPPTPASQQREAVAQGHRLPPLFAYADGLHDGRPARVSATIRRMPDGGMAAATSIPLAMGLHVLRAGCPSGVWTPEAIIDPVPFLARLAPFCGCAPDALVEVVRSWGSR